MADIALVLGAGGARGIAHIHALKAFDDLGLKPAVISGTSIGSLVGAAYCAGMSGGEAEAFVRDSLDDRFQLMTKAFQLRPSSVKSFFADGGFRLGEFNLETILSVFLPEAVPDVFEALSIPLHVIATDYYAESSTVFSTGDLRPALAASAAMPTVFLPVKRGDKVYIDGSSTNPCPLDIVQDQAAHVIAIDVSGGSRGVPGERPNKIDVMYANSQIMQQSIVRVMARQFPHTVLLRPEVDSFRSLDFLKTSEILDVTAALREQVKRALDRIVTAEG